MNAIEVKNVSKSYNINHNKGGYIALRDIITNTLKNPFRFLKNKIFKNSNRTTKEKFWALKGLDFNIEKGEIVGIIGRNGAGKSTLLKILSRITPPTEGEIRINGTVGSLLEVGTGFHPELTGRENIFLNGAILGMKKKEIVKKFDEIVKFADIDKFIDTPVKYYSSGMYVRLAFSVAAHMEPDILIVDEVLAVGDSEFQKKCLGKMEDITKKQGRAVLFVSHNMSTIRQLCKKSILLDHGKVEKIGNTSEVIDCYLNSQKNFTSIHEYNPDREKRATISKIAISTNDGVFTSQIPISKDFQIEIEYEIFEEEKAALLSVMFNMDGEIFLLSSESDKTKKLTDYKPGKYKTVVKVPAYLLNIGLYNFEVSLHRPYIEYLDTKNNLILEILDIENIKSQIFKGQSLGKTGAVLEYKTDKI